MRIFIEMRRQFIQMRSGLFLRAVVSFIGCQLISAGLLLSQQEDPAEKLLREIGQAVGAMPLQGLKDCSVVIETLNEEGVRAGLNERTLQRDVEGRLRGLGIRAVNADFSGRPYIYLKVHVSTLAGAGHIFFASLELHEMVTPKRDQSIVLGATTWHRIIQSGAAKNGLASKVSQALSVLFDDFRKDYSQVNTP